MSESALTILFEQAALCSHLSGLAIELGTYQGGSAMALKCALPHKRVITIDSFEGLQDIGAHDLLRTRPGSRGHANGDFRQSASRRSRVQARLVRLGIELWTGTFAELEPHLGSEVYCCAHADTDGYASTRAFVAHVLPRLVQGGRLILDDYGWPATPGIAYAVSEVVGVDDMVAMVGPYQGVIVKE